MHQPYRTPYIPAHEVPPAATHALTPFLTGPLLVVVVPSDRTGTERAGSADPVRRCCACWGRTSHGRFSQPLASTILAAATRSSPSLFALFLVHHASPFTLPPLQDDMLSLVQQGAAAQVEAHSATWRAAQADKWVQDTRVRVCACLCAHGGSSIL